MNINELCQRWIDAKQKESDAYLERLNIEEAICAAIPPKEEGAESHKLDGFKVTLTGVVNRKLDETAWETIKGQFPADRVPVRMKPTLDVTGVKWLRDNDPALYSVLSSAMTATPGKVGVKVEAK